jgi:hypothetical protein
MVNPPDVPTPDLDKRSKILDKSHLIGEFIDWLQEVKKWHLAADVSESTFWEGQYSIVETARPAHRGGGTFFRIKDAESVFSDYTDGRFDTREDAQAWIDGEKLRRQRVAEENPVLRVQYFNPEALLAEFFDIDLDKVEQERRAILEAIRS